MKPEIYFCRHGETEWNLQGRLQGLQDSPLSELGQMQAVRQGEILRHVVDDLGSVDIVASPLGRVRQTVDLALGTNVANLRFDPNLVEVDVGELTGTLRSNLQRSDPHLEQLGFDGFWSTYFATQQGESWNTFYDRVNNAAERIDGKSIIFAHGVVGYVLRGIFKGLSANDIAKQTASQGCVFHIKDGVETILT